MFGTDWLGLSQCNTTLCAASLGKVMVLGFNVSVFYNTSDTAFPLLGHTFGPEWKWVDLLTVAIL
jgi:hypothetical protein